nr:aldolase/citrate lyase family protein [uncultured Gellertiella sp.]
MALQASGLPVPFQTRSWLVIPPLEEAALQAGLTSGTDILVIDIAAVPDRRKAAAGEFTCAFLENHPPRDGRPALFVLVPPIDALAGDILHRVMRGRPDGLVLSSARNAADIQHLDMLVSVEEAILGIEEGRTRLAALLPQAGRMQPDGHSRRLIALLWSAEGLAEMLGAPRRHRVDGPLSDAFRQARASVLLAASTAGLEAVDSASGLFHSDKLALDAREAAEDGFTGKAAWSPRQVSTINHAFTPGIDAVRQAEAILAQRASPHSVERLRALRTLKRATPDVP